MPQDYRKMAEQCAQRQIKLLEQPFELEKEKLREEALIAKENATVA